MTTITRASDAERDAVVQALGAAHGEGRLTMDELQQRVERAVAARTRDELDGLTADLPQPRGARRGAPTARPSWPVLPVLLLFVTLAMLTTQATRGVPPWPLLWLAAMGLVVRARHRARRAAWR